jgi:hypothetical protein
MFRLQIEKDAMMLKPAVSPWRVLLELVHLPGVSCPSHRWLADNKGHILCACCRGELLQLGHGESACLRPFRGRPWHHFHPSAADKDAEILLSGKHVQKTWVCCQCDTKVAFEIAPPIVPLGVWNPLSSGQNAVALLKMLLVYQRDFLRETPRRINAENTRFLQFMTAEGYETSLNLFNMCLIFLRYLMHDYYYQLEKRY